MSGHIADHDVPAGQAQGGFRLFICRAVGACHRRVREGKPRLHFRCGQESIPFPGCATLLDPRMIGGGHIATPSEYRDRKCTQGFHLHPNRVQTLVRGGGIDSFSDLGLSYLRPQYRVPPITRRMNSFIVHISDAQGIDVQSAINVEARMDLGRAAQLALDEMVEQHGAKLTFPIFVDIHLADEFRDRAWMHDSSLPTGRHEATSS